MTHIMISPDIALAAAKSYLAKREAHLQSVEESTVQSLIEKSAPGAIGRFFGRQPCSEEAARSEYRSSLARTLDRAVGQRWEKEAKALCSLATLAMVQGIDTVMLDSHLADVLVKWKAFAGEEEGAQQ